MLDIPCGDFPIPLTLWIYEDARNANTVFVDLGSLRAVVLPPEPGYTPLWVYELAIIGVPPGDIPPPDWYAPSQVSIRITLHPNPSTLEGDDSYLSGESTLTAESLGTTSERFASATSVSDVPGASRETSTSPFDVLAAWVAGTASAPAPQATNASTVAEGLLVPTADIHVGGGETMDGESRLSPSCTTLVEGLAALNAGRGGALVVHEGIYRDDIDVREKGVLVRFIGNVTLGRAAQARSFEEPSGSSTSDNDVHSPTGAVAVAEQWEGK